MLDIRIAALAVYGRHGRSQQRGAAAIDGGLAIDVCQADGSAGQKYDAEYAESARFVPGLAGLDGSMKIRSETRVRCVLHKTETRLDIARENLKLPTKYASERPQTACLLILAFLIVLGSSHQERLRQSLWKVPYSARDFCSVAHKQEMISWSECTMTPITEKILRSSYYCKNSILP